MGGRGASSGKIVGAKITMSDGRTVSFREKNGHIFSGLEPSGRTPQESKRNLNEMIDYAKQNGYKIETFNAKQMKKMDKAYWEERKEIDKQLNAQSAKDRTNTYKAPKPWWKGH